MVIKNLELLFPEINSDESFDKSIENFSNYLYKWYTNFNALMYVKSTFEYNNISIEDLKGNSCYALEGFNPIEWVKNICRKIIDFIKMIFDKIKSWFTGKDEKKKDPEIKVKNEKTGEEKTVNLGNQSNADDVADKVKNEEIKVIPQGKTKVEPQAKTYEYFDDDTLHFFKSQDLEKIPDITNKLKESAENVCREILQKPLSVQDQIYLQFKHYKDNFKDYSLSDKIKLTERSIVDMIRLAPGIVEMGNMAKGLTNSYLKLLLFIKKACKALEDLANTNKIDKLCPSENNNESITGAKLLKDLGELTKKCSSEISNCRKINAKGEYMYATLSHVNFVEESNKEEKDESKQNSASESFYFDW